ncbi:hypothetical protein SBRCBS47491_001916 [Sporothrix bragantina]|uniref:Membrane-associated protein n=1 Tax=Sporothrix bragantina TaxID=671064 RepID=A0ABP0B2L2_9PEZI
MAPRTLSFLALILLTLASAAGITFAVLATAVLHLQVAGDVPSRIVVFGASAVSVILAGLQATTLCFSSLQRSLSLACILLARILLVAWVAAIVLTSLIVAQTVHIAAVASTLSAQAIYLNLLISGVAFIATGVLSFCLERESRRSQSQRAVIDGDDESILDRSVSQRGSLAKATELDLAEEAAEEPAEEPMVEPRPKKLLFSYKATTQLVEEKSGSRRASWVPVPAAVLEPVTAPLPEPVSSTAAIRPTSSIKRKPVQATQRRVSVSAVKPTTQPAMFSDPFADPVESDTSAPNIKPLATSSASRRLSKMPTQSLPKLVTTVAPVTAASTFYLSSSGSSNYEDDEEKTQAKETFRTSILPFSPAVTRPVSIVPPVPQVPVPQIPASQMPLPQVPVYAPSMTIPRRKPVGSAAPSGPIKRKPVPSMLVNTQTVAAAKSEPQSPLSPMSKPTIPVVPSLPAQFLSVSTATSTISSPTTQPSMHFSSFSSAVSSRKSSNASTASAESVASSSYSTPSLADMVASSLRRGLGGENRDSLDVPAAVSKAFAAAGAAPPPTRLVAYAQPRVQDQPIVRKSFIATAGTGSGSGSIGNAGSASNSRRPSEVSIMETIYSPAEGDDEQEESEDEKDEEEDVELAAMVREEAEAAAAAANAGRRWLEPSRESMREPPPPRMERNLSVSKPPAAKRPYLSPVEEKEQEQSEEETRMEAESSEDEESSDEVDEEEESPNVHTIVVHEPAGFTATGLSRTASRMRKAALQAAGQTAAMTTADKAPTYVSAYARRRLSTTASYNFSRPIRAGDGQKRLSVVSTTPSVKRSSLVAPAVPQASLLISPRSRVRRQLLQMLPVQHRPAVMIRPSKQAVVASIRKQSLSGRRCRRSLSLDLSQTSSGSGSDSEGASSSASSASSSTGRRSPSRRSASLARTAQRARRRNHGRSHHLAGLRSSTLRPASGVSERLSPYTPHNRPISPMTVLMERAR